MDAFCFNYQHVYCLYTILWYRFSGKIVAKGGKFIDIVQRALHFNHQNRGVDKMPSIAKKKLLRKKNKIAFVELYPKTTSTKISGAVFAYRIEQFEKTKFELDVINFLNCFLDGHGNFTRNLVSLKKNVCELTFF